MVAVFPKKKWLLSGLLLAFCCQLSAGDVYSLWPFSDADTATLDAVSALQNPAKFWSEKIIVNGTELQLDISLLETPIGELHKNYRQLFHGRKDVLMGGNSNSLLLQQVQKDGSLKRQYYLELSGIYPVLLFEMVLPPGLRKPTADDWPAELPFLQGAEDITCMNFPVRDATFGAFRIDNALVPQVLSDLALRLEGMGWEKVARETDAVFEGSGEVFLKDGASRILILGVSKTRNGDGVRVSMYTRAISSGR